MPAGSDRPRQCRSAGPGTRSPRLRRRRPGPGGGRGLARSRPGPGRSDRRARRVPPPAHDRPGVTRSGGADRVCHARSRPRVPAGVLPRYLTVAAVRPALRGRPPGIPGGSLAPCAAAGLHVGAPTANRLSLPVSGIDRQAAERPSRPPIAAFALPDGRVAFANTARRRAPGADRRAVQAALGPDDVALAPRGRDPAPRGPRRRPPAGGPCAPTPARPGAPRRARGAATTGRLHRGPDRDPPTASGASIRSTTSGAGQTVALVRVRGDDPRRHRGLQRAATGPARGSSMCRSTAARGAFTGDDAEAALDIDQVVGLAPKATIRVYPAPASGAGPYDPTRASPPKTWPRCRPLWGSARARRPRRTTPPPGPRTRLLPEMALRGRGALRHAATRVRPSATQADAVQPRRPRSSILASPPFATAVGGSTFTSLAGNPAQCSPGPLSGEAGVERRRRPRRVTGRRTGGGVSRRLGHAALPVGGGAGAGVVQAHSSAAPCAAAPGAPCRQVPDVSADADPFSGYVVYVTDSPGAGWMIARRHERVAPLSGRVHGAGQRLPRAAAATSVSRTRLSTDRRAPTTRPTSTTSTLVTPAQRPADNDTLGDQPRALYPVPVGYDMATGLGLPLATPWVTPCASRARRCTRSPSPAPEPAVDQGPRRCAWPSTPPTRATPAHLQRHRPAGRAAPSTPLTGRHLRHADHASGPSAVTAPAQRMRSANAGDGHRSRWTVVAPGQARKLSRRAQLTGLGKEQAQADASPSRAGSPSRRRSKSVTMAAAPRPELRAQAGQVADSSGIRSRRPGPRRSHRRRQPRHAHHPPSPEPR